MGGQGADDPREDVAGPGGGQPGAAGGVEGGPAGRIGHDRPAALEQHDGPGPFGQAPGGGHPVVPHRFAGQAGVLPGVRGHDGGGRPAGQQVEVTVEGIEAVGVEDEGDVRFGDEAPHGRHRRRRPPETGPDDEGPEPVEPVEDLFGGVLVEGARRRSRAAPG